MFEEVLTKVDYSDCQSLDPVLEIFEAELCRHHLLRIALHKIIIRIVPVKYHFLMYAIETLMRTVVRSAPRIATFHRLICLLGSSSLPNSHPSDISVRFSEHFALT